MQHTLAPAQDALYLILRSVSCNIALLWQQKRITCPRPLKLVPATPRRGAASPGEGGFVYNADNCAIVTAYVSG